MLSRIFSRRARPGAEPPAVAPVAPTAEATVVLPPGATAARAPDPGPATPADQPAVVADGIAPAQPGAPPPVATAAPHAPVAPAVEPPTLPAGVDPPDPSVPARPSFGRRSRLRRRLRYLRRARELGFRDLGGLVFDLRRFGREREDLVLAKVEALNAVDRELRALEAALADPRPVDELREAGVASCPRCGAVHGSDARFCPACGLALHGPRAVGGLPTPEAGPAPHPAPEAPEAVQPPPAAAPSAPAFGPR